MTTVNDMDLTVNQDLEAVVKEEYDFPEVSVDTLTPISTPQVKSTIEPASVIATNNQASTPPLSNPVWEKSLEEDVGIIKEQLRQSLGAETTEEELNYYANLNAALAKHNNKGMAQARAADREQLKAELLQEAQQKALAAQEQELQKNQVLFFTKIKKRFKDIKSIDQYNAMINHEDFQQRLAINKKFNKFIQAHTDLDAEGVCDILHNVFAKKKDEVLQTAELGGQGSVGNLNRAVTDIAAETKKIIDKHKAEAGGKPINRRKLMEDLFKRGL